MQNSDGVTVFPFHLSVFGHRAISICGNCDMTKGYSYNKPIRDNPKTANIRQIENLLIQDKNVSSILIYSIKE